MIELLGDDFSVQIKEDNPVYKTLKKFAGENVMIYVKPAMGEKKILNEEQKKLVEKNFQFIKNEDVFNKFYRTYPILKTDDENIKIPIWIKLLENHLTQILGSENGNTKLEKIEENLYKKDNFYLALR